jgi:hypothetical protein
VSARVLRYWASTYCNPTGLTFNISCSCHIVNRYASCGRVRGIYSIRGGTVYSDGSTRSLSSGRTAT